MRPGPSSARPPQLIRGIDFVTPDVGWVVSTVASTASVIKTNDGGATWTDAAIPCPADYRGIFRPFANTTDGLFACTFGGGAGFEGKTLYATHDGGTTWDEIRDAIGDAGYLADWRRR